MKKIALSLLFTAVAGSLLAAPPPVPANATATAASPSLTPVDATGWTTPRPPYPDAARKGKLSGSVRVRVSTDRSGHVKQVAVVQSSGHPELDDATVTFAKANWSGPKFSQAVYVQNYTYSKR